MKQTVRCYAAPAGFSALGGRDSCSLRRGANRTTREANVVLPIIVSTFTIHFFNTIEVHRSISRALCPRPISACFAAKLVFLFQIKREQ